MAVIRLSGERSPYVLTLLAGPEPPARRAALRGLHDPVSGELIDRALVLSFPAPHSFTGEAMAELQLHGSPAVVRSVLAVLAALPGLRPAEPGEFTRRALMNGRLDLAQVEGLGDLLAAETAAQRRAALRLMEGALSRRAAGWREAIVRALALVEASIDFADEEIPPSALAEARRLVGEAAADMAAALRGSRTAERLRDGFEVALVGPPNVGKSTLLNAIAGREAALTSEVAGTTRDVIEVRLELEGLPVTMLDMAGIRATEEQIEALGVARARARAEAADVRVFLVEAPGDVGVLGLAPVEDDLVLLAKGDLRGGDAATAVSGRTGAGIDALLQRLAEILGGRVAAAGSVAHERQRRAIAGARDALLAAEAQLGDDGADLAAAEMHRALRALEFLVGKSDIEAVLDVIFREFCLGK